MEDLEQVTTSLAMPITVAQHIAALDLITTYQ